MIGRIDAVPMILDVLCQSTGMGFAAVARVTESQWIACSVKDDIAFGLLAGGELDVQTTICKEVRQCRDTIVIEHASQDENFSNHPTPKLYGFESYVSTPIVLRNGTFFGTLCAIDRKPASLNTPATLGMFKLFAELIAVHIESVEQLESSQAILLEERAAAQLREQFIAVLGHDLRNPLSAIVSNAALLDRTPLSEIGAQAVRRISTSGQRMSSLIDDVLDFARGRLGGGIPVTMDKTVQTQTLLEEILAEQRVAHPDRPFEIDIEGTATIKGDQVRLGQLFSNLLTNAVTHGAKDQPIRVHASCDESDFIFSVANGGDPIPAAALDQLFQPFFRNDIRPSQQGLGLGLYIAAEIARAHDGTLDVKSSARETCFTLRMPTATTSTLPAE